MNIPDKPKRVNVDRKLDGYYNIARGEAINETIDQHEKREAWLIKELTKTVWQGPGCMMISDILYQLQKDQTPNEELKKSGEGRQIVKRKIFKYGTGQEIPEGAVYLYSCKNGDMSEGGYPCNYQYVWHYFLVKVFYPTNTEGVRHES